MDNLDSKLHEILKKYWGYDAFRGRQLEVIKCIVNNDSTLAILTTGAGKSICFQVAGLYVGGLSLVISPLISLMKDQVDRLKKIGIAAEVYNSTLNKEQKLELFDKVHSGKIAFLYVSPESMENPKFLKLLKNVNLKLVVVDEAHCISMWGHDFRPSYIKIKELLQSLKKRDVKVTAFTATATSRVKSDISRYLFNTDPKIILDSFLRSNIGIEIRRDMTIKQQLRLLQQRRKFSPILVYSNSRRRVEKLAEVYSKYGFNTGFYHAGMGRQARSEIQSGFLDDKYDLICATNAFGMGIDKPNIYTVLHETIPDSIENYYQEAGRGGRDGNEAMAYVNFNWRGINTRIQMLENNYITPAIANHVYNYLRKLVKGSGSEEILLNWEKILTDVEGINMSKLIKCLELFARAGIINIDFDQIKRGNELKLIKINIENPGIIFLSRYIDFKSQKQIFNNGKEKIQGMVGLCTIHGCRMKYILNYFGEKTDMCGKCDYCTGLSID